MNDKILKEKLDKVENMLDFTTSAIEVVANSCSHNDDYAGEDILRLVLCKQYNIQEEISQIQANLLCDILNS